ncbi:MAG: hypothetical protein ABID09_07700 [Candidatus Omnitrophota bacterium]
MDKKDKVIAILCVALLLSLARFTMSEIRLVKSQAEKNSFYAKLRETEILTTRLSQNTADLKSMLGKAREEKDKLTMEAHNLKLEMKAKIVEAGADTTAGK